ncbi:MAG: hypothetical protein ACLQIB_06515 [Isosphaeraceae bacterium]
MTHSDFNQLLSTIQALSPSRVRQLRQPLDKQFAQPKKATAPATGKAAELTMSSLENYSGRLDFPRWPDEP